MANDFISHDYVTKLLETGASGERRPPRLTRASLHLAGGTRPAWPLSPSHECPPPGEAPPMPPGPLLCVPTPWNVPLARDWHWSSCDAGTCLRGAHRSSQTPRATLVRRPLLGHPGAQGPQETDYARPWSKGPLESVTGSSLPSLLGRTKTTLQPQHCDIVETLEGPERSRRI